VDEFKTMVKALHAAGIEVILDVVYNHTAEGNELGPTLSFKGIDNSAYYRLVDGDRAHYYDTTGTGNSLLMRHPSVLQLIMDSLRYWVLEMRVDGFRFDLAATLARQFHEVDRLSAFFDLVQQAELASRLTGSSDLYQHDRRRPLASINFITAHDGFTLRDLVSYNEKHNKANGENGNDGESANRSWNCGAEGATTDPDILALRARQQRNLLTTLLISQGVPMLAHGDELGRTQRGNNNAYCQDNELAWVNWDLDDEQRELLDFTRRLIQLRNEHPVLRRRRFFRGDTGANGLPDLVWLRPDGGEMQDINWQRGDARAITVFLNGDAISEPDPRGDRILLNGHHEPLDFRLPAARYGVSWQVAVNTAEEKDASDETELKAGSTVLAEARSTLVLIRTED